jgi:CheY-like chemotaxis protein
MSRTFDRRKDALAHRVAGWIPISRDPAPGEKILSSESKTVSLPSALHVMVVDHDMRSADSVELLLRVGGYPETRVAYTAHGALAIAKEFCPAIVLIELNLRDMSSYELGHTLWERSRLRRVRLIAIADSLAHARRDGAGGGGFERFLLKPITAPDLALCLKSEQESSGDRFTGIETK